MSDPWYRDGLPFECTGCGGCCAGAPGYVWVGREEIEALARYLGLSADRFGERHLRKVRDRYSILEGPGGECIFLQDGKGCSVYPVRPRQCRTYPFWPEFLRNAESWQEVRGSCPGAGRGRVFSLEEIRRLRRGAGETGWVP